MANRPIGNGHAFVKEVDHQVYIPCSLLLVIKCVCGIFVFQKERTEEDQGQTLPLNPQLQY